MANLLQDLRVALRTLARRPSFSLVAVLTLALGAGLTTAIFSVVYGILLRPLPYAEADRVVMLWQTPRDNPRPSVIGTTSHLNYLDWKRQATSFEAMALFGASRFVLSGMGEAEVVRGAVVTPGFFEAFAATPIRGRAFKDADDVAKGPSVVVVSHGFWQERLGGRQDAVGSTIEISGRPFEVIGIAPPGFDFPLDARLWRPLQNDDQQCGRNCVYTDGIGRLKPGVSLETARSEMDAISRRLEQTYPDANTNMAIGVATLKDALVGDVKPALRLLLAAVLMVLLIACANVANLLLARGTTRTTEIAVRAALGASRRRLLKQMSVESLVLAVAGAGLGVLFAVWGIDLILRFAPPDIPRLDEVRLDVPAFSFAMALVLGTTLIFGFGPALQLTRVPLNDSLREGARSAGAAGAGRAKFALLATEVALSVVLLLGAGLLLRSFARMQAIDPGWKAEGVSMFSVSLPPGRYEEEEAVAVASGELKRRLAAIPGVDGIARIYGSPLGPVINAQNFRRTDRPAPGPGQTPSALYRTIDADYFAVMRIPLLRGRNFTGADRPDRAPVVIVSRRMADRFWTGEDPLGKQIRMGPDVPPITIVGIAADVRSETFAGAPQPEMYFPYLQTRERVFSFLIRSSRDPAQILAEARPIVHAFDPKLPLIGPSSMQELVDASLAQPRFYLLLVAMFAVLAAVLAAVGIYGVVAYVVGQRTREIGVRMALGARDGEVIRLVLWQGLRPALAGAAAGLTIALGGASALRSLLYEISPHDAVTIVSVTTLLLGLVALACFIPAARATRIPPTMALRSE